MFDKGNMNITNLTCLYIYVLVKFRIILELRCFVIYKMGKNSSSEL